MNSDDIHWLMIEQLTGEIDEADERRLAQLLDDDPKLRETFRQLQQQYDKRDLETKFERFKSPDFWEPIPAFEEKPGRARTVRMKLVSVAAAAAILAGVVIFISVYNSKPAISPGEQTIAVSKEQKVIKLQLAGGNTVNLTRSTGQVSVGNGTLLNNKNDSLSFVVQGDKSKSAAVNILTVPTGEDYKVILSDGTLVWMNSSTILKFPFNFLSNSREVTISGEAYLEVAKDADKPFIVHTDHGSVKVLGTQFNINTYDPEVLRVSLLDGAVQVNTDEKNVALKPGEEAVYAPNLNRISVQGFDEDEVIGWQQGIHYFHNNTVQEICDVLPRWYGVNVIIDNNAINNNRFTGILKKKEPIEKLLRTLKATTSINDYEYKNGELHLK
jgi:ferric-dicitrate binding protein FerR (iron transport regulator)